MSRADMHKFRIAINKLFEWLFSRVLATHARIEVTLVKSYTAPYVMLLMQANQLRGQVGGGLALEIEAIFGPVKRI